MSVNIIAELHPLKSAKINITVSPKTIADIIQELHSGFPVSHARVCRNGEIVTDFSLLAKDGDTLWIKFVPYGSNQDAGVGMKIGGWVMVGLGIAAIAAFGWTGFGGVAGAALIGAGLSLTLGGTVLMNVNTPTLKDTEKPENDPSIRGGKNQARPHGRIPVLFGRHRIYPDLAANQHTEIIGNQQYFTQLFCGGYKNCVIDLHSIKLGETPITKLSQTRNIQHILSGNDPVVRMEILQNGEESSLYPYCVHEDSINAPLQNQIDGGDGTKISGEIIRTTPDNTDTINVDIFFHNGIGQYDDEGNLLSASVEVQAFYKRADEEHYQPLGFFHSSNTISGSELKTKRFQITKSGLPRGTYTVKIERITPDSTNSKVIDMVHVGSIRSIKSERPIRAERQKDLTIIALRVMATGKMNGVVDSFNYIATSKLPVYAGSGSGALSWQDTAETRNPAAMLMHALRGRAAQQQVDPNDIDWPSIEAFYTWCAEHHYTCNAYLSESVTIAELIRMIGNTARADIIRIDSKISVVQDIERPAPVQLFTPKNTISYSITMLKADIPDAIALRFIDENAGYAQNELSVYNTPDGNRIIEAESTQKTNLWGITDNIQVRRIGMYNYACLNNRPFVHTIDVDIEYLMCNKGDWIQYAGDIALTGSVQGRIKGVIWADGVCIGIDTDEPVVMTAGTQYAVRIRLSNGIIMLKEVIFSPGLPREKSITYYPGDGTELYEPFVGDMYAVDEGNVYYEPQNVIFFTEPIQESGIPKAGDIYAFGVRGYEVIDLVITDIQPGTNVSANLTCVEYSPEIFGVDDPAFILPAFINKITPVSGAVDPGVVNSNRLMRFIVYHDSEAEPERPAGNGQEGGWYQLQNFRSIWQSTKIAESIDEGEWGLPVRIKAQRGTDDITPIWLGLTPQNIILETDGDGNILAGLLPLTAQARLFQWNSLVSDGLFSLANAPTGVSINTNGLITVGINTALDDINNITVQAEYQGNVYTAVFVITKNFRNSAPRYLGTITALPSTATATIIKGPVQGQVRAFQGDFVFAITALDGRSMGSVFQWDGVTWQYRDPIRYTDLYTRCFKDGLDVPGFANNVEWFGALFASRIAAMKAFIEELEAQVITLRANGVIQSQQKDSADMPLFQLFSNGLFRADRASIRGNLMAESLDAGPISVHQGSPVPAPITFTGHSSPGFTAVDIFNFFRSVGIWNIASGHFTSPYSTNQTSTGQTVMKQGAFQRIEIIRWEEMRTYWQGGASGQGQTVSALTTIIEVYIYRNSLRILIAKTMSAYVFGEMRVNNDPFMVTGESMTFTIPEFGKMTLKLLNLPTQIPTESGTVYTQSDTAGNFFLKMRGV
ncbi:MAG: host specificity factor TipJ family phage tail protein [Treponema sp.]|nr:host specificity factor TipJ family phage tail protein [Treponema sp.]